MRACPKGSQQVARQIDEVDVRLGELAGAVRVEGLEGGAALAQILLFDLTLQDEEQERELVARHVRLSTHRLEWRGLLGGQRGSREQGIGSGEHRAGSGPHA